MALRCVLLALGALALPSLCQAQANSTCAQPSSVKSDKQCFQANAQTDPAAFYYCSDRYIWKWADDPANLPYKWSDSLIVSMDKAAVPGLNTTTMFLFSGCDEASQAVNGTCTNLTNDTRLYDPAANVWPQ